MRRIIAALVSIALVGFQIGRTDDSPLPRVVGVCRYDEPKMVCWDLEGRLDPALSSSVDRRLLKERSLHEIQTEYGKKRRNVIVVDEAQDPYQNVLYHARGSQYAYQFSIGGDSLEPPTVGVGISFPREQAKAHLDIDLPVNLTIEQQTRALEIRVGESLDFKGVHYEITDVRGDVAAGEKRITRVEILCIKPSGWRVDLSSPIWSLPSLDEANRSFESAKSSSKDDHLVFEMDRQLPPGTRLLLRPRIWRPVSLGLVPLDPLHVPKMTLDHTLPLGTRKDVPVKSVSDLRLLGICRITDERIDAWDIAGRPLPSLKERIARAQSGGGPVDVAYGMKMRYLAYEGPSDIRVTTRNYNSLSGLVRASAEDRTLKLVPLQTDPSRKSGQAILDVRDYRVADGERNHRWSLTTPVFRLDPDR